MGRAPRIEAEGGLFHITARGNRRQPIYSTDVDYRLFLAVASSVALKLGWLCRAYCLMPNQYHLVIETPNAGLSRGMHPSTARTRISSTSATVSTATSSNRGSIPS